MGIFDFFRKLVEEEKLPEVKEKLPFSEIENFISKKDNEIIEKEKETIQKIKERISLLSNEIKEKIEVVRNFDVEQKKSDDKFKYLTNEGRQKYLEFVENLVYSLENTEKERLEEFFSRIDKLFSDFNKHSHMSYERATVLIGKEMASLRDTLKSFSKDTLTIFEENKNILDSSKKFNMIKSKLNQIEEIELEIKEISENAIVLNSKLELQTKENTRIQEDIEKTKTSSHYLDNIKNKEKILSMNNDLERDISKLRETIDFKTLSNFFHSNEKQMNIIKSYKDNLKENIEKDDGKALISLLDEASLPFSAVSEKITQINIKKKAIEEIRKGIKEDEVQLLSSELTKIILDIGNLKNEKAREEKREEKLQLFKKDIIAEIKEDMDKIGVVVG